jgi:hypothetical protein
VLVAIVVFVLTPEAKQFTVHCSLQGAYRNKVRWVYCDSRPPGPLSCSRAAEEEEAAGARARVASKKRRVTKYGDSCEGADEHTNGASGCGPCCCSSYRI